MIMQTGEGRTTWGLLVKEYKVLESEAGLTSNPSNVSSPDDSVATDLVHSPESIER